LTGVSRNWLIELSVNLYPAHSQDGTVQINIFPAGQLRMKTGANLQQGTDSPVDLPQAFCWLRHPGKDLEQGAFPGAITPDDAQNLALPDFKR
jgi:hypothetical protein